jgi:hypothetical protein
VLTGYGFLLSFHVNVGIISQAISSHILSNSVIILSFDDDELRER